MRLFSVAFSCFKKSCVYLISVFAQPNLDFLIAVVLFMFALCRTLPSNRVFSSLANWGRSYLRGIALLIHRKVIFSNFPLNMFNNC